MLMISQLEEVVMELGDKYETILWLSDTHVPFEDRKSVKAVLAFAKDLRPDYVVAGGDMVDFYSVSSYDKDPRRANKLQEELDKGKDLLARLRGVVGHAPIVYLEGNHENRLARYLRANPELSSLKALEIPELLGFRDLGIEYRAHWLYKDFLFKHGDYTNKYHAEKELTVEGISGMSGHNHRNQMMCKSDRRGELAWYSVGHLSDRNKVDYMENKVANWQQGIAVVYFKKGSNRFHVTPIPIVQNKFLYNGKQYGV